MGADDVRVWFEAVPADRGVEIARETAPEQLLASYCALEASASNHFDNLLGGDVDGGSRCWVPTGASGALQGLERDEAWDRDLVAGNELRGDNTIESGEDLIDCILGEARAGGNRRNELHSVHISP
jgi:hypothetical protein